MRRTVMYSLSLVAGGVPPTISHMYDGNQNLLSMKEKFELQERVKYTVGRPGDTNEVPPHLLPCYNKMISRDVAQVEVVGGNLIVNVHSPVLVSEGHGHAFSRVEPGNAKKLEPGALLKLVTHQDFDWCVYRFGNVGDGGVGRVDTISTPEHDDMEMEVVGEQDPDVDNSGHTVAAVAPLSTVTKSILKPSDSKKQVMFNDIVAPGGQYVIRTVFYTPWFGIDNDFEYVNAADSSIVDDALTTQFEELSRTNTKINANTAGMRDGVSGKMLKKAEQIRLYLEEERREEERNTINEQVRGVFTPLTANAPPTTTLSSGLVEVHRIVDGPPTWMPGRTKLKSTRIMPGGKKRKSPEL